MESKIPAACSLARRVMVATAPGARPHRDGIDIDASNQTPTVLAYSASTAYF
jgi:hypothetical protein